MSVFDSPKFLRNVLWADVVAGAASSLLHLLTANALAGLLGLPAGVLVMSGALLLLYVAAAMYLAAYEPISRKGVGMLVAANWAWVGGCAVVVLMHAGTATPMGQAYMIVHALAELEWFGLRRAPRIGWA